MDEQSFEYKFLRIDFYDNDFGGPVVNAISRIWRDIKNNNYHITSKINPNDGHFSDRSMSEMFYGLHKVDLLEKMLKLTIDCEYLYSKVEFATRGLYWKKLRLSEKEVDTNLESITDGYLDFKLSFHKDDSFIKEWNDGESAFLNLETGEVSPF
jgi:hypothetical protein